MNNTTFVPISYTVAKQIKKPQSSDRISFVYFDVGEVLIRGAHTRDIARLLNISYDLFRPVFKKYQEKALRGHMSSERFLETLKQELPLDPSLKDYITLWKTSVSPITQMHTLLKQLHKTYRLGLLTNMFEGLIDEMAQSLPLDVIIQSSKTGLIKPEEAIYLFAEEKAGVNPPEILFIDDNSTNIQTAQKRNWQTVLFDPNNVEASMQEIYEKVGYTI